MTDADLEDMLERAAEFDRYDPNPLTADDIPKLIAEVRRLRAENADLRAAVQRYAVAVESEDEDEVMEAYRSALRWAGPIREPVGE